MRTIINTLEYYKTNKEKILLIFVDAEKAFDNIKWTFMLEILKRMEMGDKFIGNIKQIYNK